MPAGEPLRLTKPGLAALGVLCVVLVSTVWSAAVSAALCLSTLVRLPAALRFWPPFLLATLLAGAWLRKMLMQERLARLFGAAGASERRREALILALRWAAPLAVAGCCLLLTGSVWRHRLKDLRSDLRTQGFPASLAELWSAVPKERCADPRLTTAFQTHDSGIQLKLHPGEKLQAWTESVYRAETGFVKAQEAPLLKVIEPLLAQKPLRYAWVDPAAYARRPWDIPLPKFSRTIAHGNALRLFAGWHAYRGETGPAWDRVRQILSLSELISNEPTLIAKMIAVALRGQGAAASCTVLLNAKAGLMPEDVRNTLSSPGPELWVNAGLRGEATSILEYLAVLGSMGWKEFTSFGGIFGGLIQTACLPDDSSDSCLDAAAGLFGRPLEFAVLRWARLAGVLDLNALEAARSYALICSGTTFNEHRGLQERQARLVADWTVWPHGLALLMTSKADGLHEKAWKVCARSRLAVVASALKAYRAEHGRFPDRLESLPQGPALAAAIQDPFAGAPFLYSSKAGGRGFELCSAGPEIDRKDAKRSDLCLVWD